MRDAALVEAINKAREVLPVAVDDGSEFEPLMGHAPTDLIKRFEAPISAVVFYKLLAQKGLLEIKTRPSETVAGGKDYKHLTEWGINFGYNEVLRHGGLFKGSQPRFYQETFPILINYLLK